MSKTLEEVIGWSFGAPGLLRLALTHASTSQVEGSADNNERLEFLGDRVLGLSLANMLYEAFPGEREGAMARRLAALARKETLARVARAWGLDKAVVLSASEIETGGRDNDSILSDACEAVLGAIYLDGGFPAADTVVRRWWTPLRDENITPPKDPKTALQEWAQGQSMALPLYSLEGREGPDHSPIFTVTVSLENGKSAEGRGTSKRAAEQSAAKTMLSLAGKL